MQNLTREKENLKEQLNPVNREKDESNTQAKLNARSHTQKLDQVEFQVKILSKKTINQYLKINF